VLAKEPEHIRNWDFALEDARGSRFFGDVLDTKQIYRVELTLILPQIYILVVWWTTRQLLISNGVSG
jgi:hypothetical protein